MFTFDPTTSTDSPPRMTRRTWAIFIVLVVAGVAMLILVMSVIGADKIATPATPSQVGDVQPYRTPGPAYDCLPSRIVHPC